MMFPTQVQCSPWREIPRTSQLPQSEMKRHRIAKILIIIATLGVLLAGFRWVVRHDINSLTLAAKKREVRATRLNLLFGVDPNQPSRYGYRRHASGYTPLAAASFAGHREIARILIDHGADVDLRSGSDRYPGSTPLSSAVCGGQLEMCRLLLEAGADPNIPGCPHVPGDPGGWISLDWALQAQEFEIAELLREYHAIEGTRKQRRQ